jgi:signal transduction histidine kinase/CheY-like chemotaxis protein
MSGELILVIDDSREIVRHLTEHLLPTFGYKSLHAYDGKGGLELLRQESPDLVMLDFNLPEMTGVDLLRQMVEESISTPVVLMTGYGSELSAIEAFRLGAKDYLVKPFTVDEIVETIDRALVETRLLQDKEELAEELRRSKVEMSRLKHEMNILSRVGKAITSLLSVDKVLERVLETATYLTDAEDSTIWMPDEDGIYLHAYGSATNEEYETPAPILTMSNSQVGQVMRTGKPLRLSDFSGGGVKVETGYFARAILYIPLNLRSVTLGVLAVSNVAAQRSFSKRDEFLLSFLADYAAIALENSRVFQAADQALAARLEELRTLIQITRTITSTLDLDEVVNETIKQVFDSWQIEACSLWWVDDARENLTILANVGSPAEPLAGVSVPIGEGFVGHVARSGKWIYTNDVASHPLHYKEVDDRTGFKTEVLLCVPLLYRDEVVGVMQLLNKLDGEFDDGDVERALSIAAAVAIAVTNALLFKDSELQKQHLEATLEHNSSPMLILDAENRLLLLNQEARNRLELAETAIGKTASDVVKPELLADLLATPLEEIGESLDELVLEDGSVWIPRVAPIPGHGRILILQDIMGLKELDKAKDHFVASVSHDLRAPLNTISGFVNSLQDVGPLNTEQEKFVERILNATDHMMSLVGGLLELAKVNVGTGPEHEPCDVLRIVTEVVADLQGQALARQVALVLTADERLGPVSGDPNQLRRAIGNLVDNAIKFSPESKQVHILASEDSNCVLIEVRDCGVGIAEADLPHIFEKFYRGSDTGNTIGSGLGLALVSSVARSHEGHVWAENRDGSGSSFYLQLPICRPN